jgi:hypothetical protein
MFLFGNRGFVWELLAVSPAAATADHVMQCNALFRKTVVVRYSGKL